MDSRFDRVYFIYLKYKDSDSNLERMKKFCEEYNIKDNGVFKGATCWHFAYGIGPDGLIYISPTTFLHKTPDFYSIEEIEAFLDKFAVVN